VIILKPYSWAVAEDAVYYDGRKEVKAKRLLTSPLLYEVAAALAKGEPFSVLAPFPPYAEFKNFFKVVRLPNSHGILTSQEYEEGGYLSQIEKKLGLKVHRPGLTLADLKGAENFKREIEFLSAAAEDYPGLVFPRGVLLVGLPGTGKSYSAKCAAGQMKRLLIELNLSLIMTDDDPIGRLHRTFEAVSSLKDPFILWVDEVEKMFTEGDSVAKKVMGQMLTIMQEWNSPSGYGGNGFFWATANDVKVLVERHPEFFRRFEFRFFVNTPREEEAVELFRFYLSKYGIKPFSQSPEEEDWETLIRIVQRELFRDFVEEESGKKRRFLYTPSEVGEQICKKLAQICRRRGRDYFTEEEYREVCLLNRPMKIQMKDAIDAMEENKKFFVEV